MDKLLSSKQNIENVPDSYVHPPETRPGGRVISSFKGIPVIELHRTINCDRQELIESIIKAAREFGFFQLADHGVPEELMQDVLKLSKEFFQLPVEKKESLYSEDPMKRTRLFTSINYDNEKTHFWRDNLRHFSYPLEDHVKDWPEHPARYREVMGRYVVHVRELSLLLLELICEGLGLESGYCGGLAKVQVMSLNHYPACPDPSLTLGLPKHADPNLITLLSQGPVAGLQILRDDEWLAVDPVPNAFVVNIGYALQIISNGKLRSVDHRVVTNTDEDRTTVATFTHLSGDTLLEPASALVDAKNPPLYKPSTFIEFYKTYAQDIQEGRPPLKPYEYSSKEQSV